ncbi:TolC family protein [Puteibacter caeruleilacunae]|nr:TolC family protein [Puteibacter caeruleilacunae]
MKNYIIIILLMISGGGFAQSINDVLESVATNNTILKAEQQEMDATILDNKTGLTPSNPQVNYGRMPAGGSKSGHKTVWGVSQSFSFPTTYFRKVQVAELLNQKAEVQNSAARQEILLEAKKSCIELIYLNKMKDQLEIRTAAIEKLAESLKKRMQTGDASVIEMNKAKIELIKFQNQKNHLETSIQNVEERLAFFNGGQPLNLKHLNYPVAIIESKDQLLQEAVAKDPVFAAAMLNKDIASAQVKLDKSQWLPDFTVGYESEETPGDKFAGARVGLSIPLWEKKNTVKRSRARLQAVSTRLEAYKQELTSNTVQNFNKFSTQKHNLDNYQQTMNQVRNAELLAKALRLGHISTIEYIHEMSWYYDAEDNAMLLEKEYYLSQAELLKFRL